MSTVLRVLLLSVCLGEALWTQASVVPIRTIVPGVLTVAVTTLTPTGPYDSQLWIQRYLERFATEQRLTIRWVVVRFDQSWWRASRNEVDLVATNVASFPDRRSPGATFSAPFLYERRALRIRPQDRNRYAHIDDFAGRTVGVVIPSHGDDVVLVDLHDLTPGQREESVFVVSDTSTGLLAAINQFIAASRFPL